LALDNSKDLYSIGKYLTEHLKVAGGYWSLTSLAALQHPLGEERTEKIVAWLKGCQNKDGGFGGNIGHDSHLTSTHYAVLVLLLFGRIKYCFINAAKSAHKRSSST
jgi:geranylgeranyl transferase type-2 subunit beta